MNKNERVWNMWRVCGEGRGVERFLVGKSDGKESLGRC